MSRHTGTATEKMLRTTLDQRDAQIASLQRALEQETAARKEAETSSDERQIMKAALTKIAAQNVEGTGGFEMFRSCVKVAKDALKNAAKAREKS